MRGYEQKWRLQCKKQHKEGKPVKASEKHVWNAKKTYFRHIASREKASGKCEELISDFRISSYDLRLSIFDFAIYNFQRSSF